MHRSPRFIGTGCRSALTDWWGRWIHRSTQISGTSGAASRVGDTPLGYNQPTTRRLYPAVKKVCKLCWIYFLAGVTGRVWFSNLINAALSAWPRETSSNKLFRIYLLNENRSPVSPLVRTSGILESLRFRDQRRHRCQRIYHKQTQSTANGN